MVIHAAYACDEAYAVQTAVSMTSLCEHHRSDEIFLYLIEDGIDISMQRDIRELIVGKYRQHLKIVSLGPLLKHLTLSSQDRHPRTIYAKLFLTDICPADRILYLDSDTIVADSLSGLFSINMDNAYIAGVKMPYSEVKKSRLGISDGIPYLCDGLLLLNLKKWRKDRMWERCTAYIRSHCGNPPMLSEGTVNYAAHGLIKVLPPKYNLMSGMLLWNAVQLAQLYGVEDYYTQDELTYARANPVIIHYLNELYIRPWYKNSDHPYRAFYWKYCRMSGFDKKNNMRAGSIRMRTGILRILNRFLPFWIFRRLYHAVKGKE